MLTALPEERLVRFRATTVLTVLGLTLAVVVLLELVLIARQVITWLLIAVFLALALNPLVDWFQRKLDREVTHELLRAKAYARLQPGSAAPPDSDTLRAIRANLRYHMGYISYLAHERRWLAGEKLSFADLAAAAHLSSIDYVGEVPWEEFPVAKSWYARIKSRPAFRGLLADRIPGAPPPSHYEDLDF